MNKIVITVPKKDKKWKWSLGGKNKRHYLRADTLLKAIERCFSMRRSKEKTCVKIKDGDVYVNESYPSYNSSEQLWTTSCFLEDYLSSKVKKSYERKFFNA